MSPDPAGDAPNVAVVGDLKSARFYLPEDPGFPVRYLPPPRNRLTRALYRRFPATETFLPPRRPGAGGNLVHAFARIPLTRLPWVITFEQFLPRPYGGDGRSGAMIGLARRMLLRRNCRAIIAMSDYARRFVLATHADWPGVAALAGKMHVVLPGIHIRAERPKLWRAGEPLKILFVGGEFARKGGIVGLRIAERARQRGLPIELHVVSDLKVGPGVYTDHRDRERYAADFELLQNDNVHFHGLLPYDRLLEVNDACHFGLLASLDENFGFSGIEALGSAMPLIATNVNALPEVVRDGENGLLLALETNAPGHWVQRGHYFASAKESGAPEMLRRRESDEYWAVLDAAFDDLAEQALHKLEAIVAAPDRYRELSTGALATARAQHDIDAVGRTVHALYRDALAG